jgi:hypothetical protein
MKLLIASVAVLATVCAASAQPLYGTGSNPNSHTISPYTTQSGTYHPPAQATNPNPAQSDNYSTRGNVNPYTGAIGTRTPKW